MRLLILFLGLALLVLISFFVWGDTLMGMFSESGSIDFLKRFGYWGWFVGILLLMADLLLPLPATLVMAALGFLYGPVVGGLVSAAGSFMSGMVGYWACRLLGEKTAIRLLGARDYERGRKLSGTVGGWVIVLSRWLPVFPEVVACMAGLTGMPARYFHVALLCGSLPLGFVYAFVGYTGIEHPALSIVLSAGLPPLIWWIIRPVFQKRLNA